MAVDNPPSPAPTMMIFKVIWPGELASAALNRFRNWRQLLGYVVLYHSSVCAILPVGSRTLRTCRADSCGLVPAMFGCYLRIPALIPSTNTSKSRDTQLIIARAMASESSRPKPDSEPFPGVPMSPRNALIGGGLILHKRPEPAPDSDWVNYLN
jgi:hypothetical protein